MIIGGVLLLEGSKNILPGGCIGVLGRFIRLFDIYQLCSGVHPLDVTGHIRLDGGGKISCSP